MTRVRFTLRGETFITLEGIAECYECEVEWVREVYDLGLLGRGEAYEGRTAVPGRMLERVAQLRRLCVYHGVDPTIVELLLEED